MNMTDGHVLHIVEGDDGLETAYIRTAHNGSVFMTQIPRVKISDNSPKCYSNINEVVEHGKQFPAPGLSRHEEVQEDLEVSTILVPIVGLEESDANIELQEYDSTPGISMEEPSDSVADRLSIDTSRPEVSIFPVLQNISTNAQEVMISSVNTTGNILIAVPDTPNILPVKKDNPVVPLQKPTPKRSPLNTRGFVKYGRSRMVADSRTSISVADFKAQLNDTSDIITPLQFAPPTKKLMDLLQCKTKLFSLPGRKRITSKLAPLYFRHMTVRKIEPEETFSDMTLLPLGYQPKVDLSKIKRITRKRRYPEAEEYQRKLLQEQLLQGLQINSDNSKGPDDVDGVFMENTDPLQVQESDETVNQCHCEILSLDQIPDLGQRVVNIYTSGELGSDEVYVIQENENPVEVSTDAAQQNVEVVLAPAPQECNLNQDNLEQVIICESDGDSYLQECGPVIYVNESLLEALSGN